VHDAREIAISCAAYFCVRRRSPHHL